MGVQVSWMLWHKQLPVSFSLCIYFFKLGRMLLRARKAITIIKANTHLLKVCAESMLLEISHWLRQFDSSFRVFDFYTLRALLSLITSLLLTLFMGPLMIRWLQHRQLGQVVRADGPSSHLHKANTPTMGGLLILLSVCLCTLLWSDLNNTYAWIVLATICGFALIGCVDDLRKIRTRSSRGLPARWKFFWQAVLAALLVSWLYAISIYPEQTELIAPFFKNVVINLGWWFLPLAWLVLVSSANSLNITDGLDGLALGPCILIISALGVFAYASGNAIIANYLQIPHLPDIGEVVIFCAALAGAGIGFLWFNTYPAQVFMGDVGSLALGSALGIVAVMVRQEIVFFIMSGVLVLESLSVILQVASFKLTGKRLFLMAPLHHHFELKGLPEPKVIVRFWIVTVIFVAIGLATLKIR